MSRKNIFLLINKINLLLKGEIFLIFVNKENFKEMVELGFIKQGDYATTMKNHSKSKRHKHYIREDKYAKYLKYKSQQKKN